MNRTALLNSVTLFILRRFVFSLLVIFAAVTITFFLMSAAPGNPFSKERDIPPAILKQLEIHYKLDGTPWQIYRSYMWDLVHGDLRLSTQYRNRTVCEILKQTLPVSMILGIGAFILSLSIGTTLGIYSAVHHRQAGDRWAMFWALLGISTPGFILAPFLILIFCVDLHLLPTAGWGRPSQIILPMFCLAAPFVASVARLMRGSMLEVLHQDFVRTARAKGLDQQTVIYRHALKVAILPVISYAGPLAANLLTGSLVIEQIFAIPGIGPFFINGVFNRDMFLVEGIVVVYSAFLISFNFLVDVAYTVLDRRIRQT